MRQRMNETNEIFLSVHTKRAYVNNYNLHTHGSTSMVLKLTARESLKTNASVREAMSYDS